MQLDNKYTLFDGLAYNTCGYFASSVAFFRAPQGRGKIRTCPLVIYANPWNKRFIIPLQKNCYFAIGFYFFGKRIQKHPGSVCENDVNNEKNVRGYYTMYVKPSNERLIFLPEKNLLFCLLFSGKSIQNNLILLHPPVFALL